MSVLTDLEELNQSILKREGKSLEERGTHAAQSYRKLKAIKKEIVRLSEQFTPEETEDLREMWAIVYTNIFFCLLDLDAPEVNWN